MKSAIQDLAAKGLIYGLGASFNGLVSFLLIPFFTHRLTAGEYGRYALAEMVLNLLLVLLGMGLNVAILARYPRIPPVDRSRYFGSIISFTLLSTGVCEVLFLALARVFGASALPLLPMRILMLVAGISAVETIWLIFATLYRAEGRAWTYISASALQALTGLLATVYLIARMGFRDEGILLGRFTGDVGLLVLVLIPQMRKYPLTARLAPARELLRIGLPLVPATFSTMWILTSPRYIIQWFGGLGDVGTFAMSSKIAAVVQLFYIQPFAMAWMVSLFTIYEREDAPRVYARVLTYYLLAGLGLALTVALAAQALVPSLAEKAFPLSAAIVLFVALAQVASGLMYPVTIGPYVLEQTGRITPVFLFSALLMTGIGTVLVRLWGATGGAASLLVVYIAQALALAWVSHKLYPIPFETARILKVLCALGAAFALVHLVGLVSPHPSTTWFLPPLFVVAGLLGLIAVRFPDSGEMSHLRALGARILGRSERA